MSVVEFIRGFFDALIHLPAKKRLSFEDIIKMFSKDIDKIILSQNRKGKKFFAGNFYIRELNGINFKPSFEIYFTIPGEEDCEVVKNESIVIPMSRLKSEAILELKANKELIFAITAPENV